MNRRLVPLKYLCSRFAEYGANEPATNYVDDGVRFLRTTDITDEGTLTPIESGVFLPESSVSDYLLQDGDLLLSRSGTIGRSLVFDRATHGPCAYAGYLVRFRPRHDVEPRFLFYFTKTTAFVDQIASASIQTTILNFNGQKFGGLLVPVPARSEQRRIVSFLDRKAAAIDALIAKKERLIDLLQYKRQALITQAVTKGAGPNASMKATGVPWFGAVPAHWEVHQLRRAVARFIDYRGRTPTKVDDGVPLITAGAVRDGRIDHSRAPEYMLREEYAEFMRRGLPELGDVVFTTEAPLGEVAQVTDTSVAFAQRIILFKVNRARMTSEFLWLFYCSKAGICEVQSRASGSTAEGIRADRLRGSLVLVPPVPEQLSIVRHVRAELGQLDPIGGVIEEQLHKLREYRQALITAAVTGKLDVSKEAP